MTKRQWHTQIQSINIKMPKIEFAQIEITQQLQTYFWSPDVWGSFNVSKKVELFHWLDIKTHKY